MARQYWRDTRFALALLAGPMVWLMLYGAGLPLSGVTPAMSTYAVLVFVYPILEEIVFRGGLHSILLSRQMLARPLAGIAGLTAANLLTSLLFAGAHLLNQPVLWAALVFVPSLVFGWARERFNRLLPPIILHVFYNAGFIGLFVNTQ